MLVVLVLGAVVAVGILVARVGDESEHAPVVLALNAAIPSGETTHSPTNARPPHHHPVLIHEAAGPPRLRLDRLNLHGDPVTIACSTCHTIREPNRENRSTEHLDEFHQDLAFAHGQLSCLSCHNESDYDTLRLADGAEVPYERTITLCGQCHGTQYRDYQHGAHGGMTGYWDITKGPRVRNTCTDCHDPHAPKMPHMIPTFKPRDRFLTTPGSGAEATHD